MRVVRSEESGTMKQRDLTVLSLPSKQEELLAETPRSVHKIYSELMLPVLTSVFAASAKGSTGFEIRGNTLKAGSEPLIVIDGVIYEGDLTDINQWI